jgi:hypothetical protein
VQAPRLAMAPLWPAPWGVRLVLSLGAQVQKLAREYAPLLEALALRVS